MAKSDSIRPSYYELLKHPAWQKKRLEIMERDDWSCGLCGSKDTTLNVHHTYYEKGCKPWEYPSESLRTLCEKCHQSVEDVKTLLNRRIGMLGTHAIESLYGYALALWMEENPSEPVEIPGASVAESVAQVFSTNHGFVLHHLLEGGTITADYLRDRLMEWHEQHDRTGK